MAGLMKSGKHAGFTYIHALLLIAILGAVLAATGQVWSRARQREKETELIWIGNQFTQAIGLYYQRSPGTVKRYPEKLEDLLEDKRYLSRQRYLRRIYRDPMTGSYDWGVVLGPDGGVAGVYSLSARTAIKQKVFSGEEADRFNDARYSDWRFVYSAPNAGVTAQH